MAAGTSLICEVTILSDCSYQSFSIWALFLVRSVQFLFSFLAM